MDHQCMAKCFQLLYISVITQWEIIVFVERKHKIKLLGNNIECSDTALYSLLFLSYLIVLRSLESVRGLGHVSFLKICFYV